MPEYIKKLPLRRVIVMCFGIVVLGLGIAMFKLSGFGNDSTSAMTMAIADTLGISFALCLIETNCVFFVLEYFFARRYIGIGTLVNWFCVGVCTDFFYGVMAPETQLSMGARILVLAAGMIVLSFGCALYQTSDVGIAPYDSVAIILTEKTNGKYFFCRIGTDLACLVIALLFHGLIGAGTFICTFCLGPFVSFFTKHCAAKLCGVESKFV